MGTKPRRRISKFKPANRGEAEALCAYWRRVLQARGSMVAEAIAGNGLALRNLDKLDAALAEVKVEGKRNVEESLRRGYTLGAVLAVDAVAEVLRLQRDGVLVAEATEMAAIECGVSPGVLNSTIADPRIQRDVLGRGHGLQKAALAVVGIINDVSASTVDRWRQEYLT